MSARTFALILMLLVPGSPRAETPPPVLDRQSDLLVDALVLRPLGLVATGVGAGVFILTLPFTLPSGSVGDAACSLVADPFAYTFTRPLGDVENLRGQPACSP